MALPCLVLNYFGQGALLLRTRLQSRTVLLNADRSASYYGLPLA